MKCGNTLSKAAYKIVSKKFFAVHELVENKNLTLTASLKSKHDNARHVSATSEVSSGPIYLFFFSNTASMVMFTITDNL